MGISKQRRFIPVDKVFAEWEKDPGFRAAYDALAEEFALASSLIEARMYAKMTDEQIAQEMGITSGALARLLGVRPFPSIRTLQRFAKATGTRLKINFEPHHSR